MKKILFFILALSYEASYSQITYSTDKVKNFDTKKSNSIFFSFAPCIMPAQKIIPVNDVATIKYVSKVVPSYSFGISFSREIKKLKFETGIKEIDFSADTRFRLDSSILGYEYDEQDLSIVSALFNIPLIISYKIIDKPNSELTAGIQISLNRVPAYSYGAGVIVIDSMNNQSEIYNFKAYENRKDFIDAGINLEYEHRLFHKFFAQANFNSLFISNKEIMNGGYSIYGKNETYTGVISKRFRYYAMGLGIGWCF